MAPLGANQNEKPTNESGELVSETASMEMHPAPLTPGNMFSRLAGIGILLLVVVLSAARYPIVLFGSVHFSPILPHSVMVYAGEGGSGSWGNVKRGESTAANQTIPMIAGERQQDHEHAR